MTKHIKSEVFYCLPSGRKVHPSRLLLKDGTIMWKDALLSDSLFIPSSEAHENHILKTAQRLEELNSWVSHGLEPWESLNIVSWYVPNVPDLSEGICVYFNHSVHDIDYTYSHLSPHVQDHELLEIRNGSLFFRRC
jgi:hypothetical protein